MYKLYNVCDKIKQSRYLISDTGFYRLFTFHNILLINSQVHHARGEDIYHQHHDFKENAGIGPWIKGGRDAHEKANGEIAFLPDSK